MVFLFPDKRRLGDDGLVLVAIALIIGFVFQFVFKNMKIKGRNSPIKISYLN
jgi:hypothetical protein